MKIESLLNEKRIFKPSKEIVKNSNIKKWMEARDVSSYDELLEKAKKDPEWFWGELAEELDWEKKWDNVLEWNRPFSKWFKGAKTNIVQNCLDKHALGENKNKLAYYWEGEDGEERKFTYLELYKKVNKFANSLKELGVEKGDRVAVYLPMIPELPISMLACAKIGAIHSVVFSGYSSKALETRIKDARAKVLITVDGFYRRGNVVPLKEKADKITSNCKTLEKTIVVQRIKNKVNLKKEKEVWWHDITKGQSEECETEIMDSNDPLFILYTSGTTGKPKGVIHDHGGYSVGTYATLKFVFDLKPDDIWWCAADIGWITGHSYIVYAPLMHGVTSVMYEGAPNYPEKDHVWKLVDKYKVTVFYCAPTLVRLYMKYGKDVLKNCSLKTLRLLGSVGEPINPEAWIWYYKYIGNEKCPIMDTWWQTETGMFMITPVPVLPLKPGSATYPFPGIKADVYDEEGGPITDKGGHLVINTPWPAMLKTLYRNPERYKETYWKEYDDAYLAGDVARKDEDGYFWIQGRSDDVLNVAGHRIGSAEVESGLVSHPAVAEAAVVGVPHDVKGEEIKAFVILRESQKESGELKEKLRAHVGDQIGPIAKPSEIMFVPDLPKTRSGKIMRRVLKSLEQGKEIGDLSTLKNPEIVEEIKEKVKKKNNS